MVGDGVSSAPADSAALTVADRAPIAITRQRGEGAVLISESEWASIEETLYLLRSPKNAERLLEAVRGFEADEPKAIDYP